MPNPSIATCAALSKRSYPFRAPIMLPPRLAHNQLRTRRLLPCHAHQHHLQVHLLCLFTTTWHPYPPEHRTRLTILHGVPRGPYVITAAFAATSPGFAVAASKTNVVVMPPLNATSHRLLDFTTVLRTMLPLADLHLRQTSPTHVPPDDAPHHHSGDLFLHSGLCLNSLYNVRKTNQCSFWRESCIAAICYKSS